MTSVSPAPFTIRGALSRARQHLRLRRHERILSALDDHILRDIGLHRSEIGSALRHHDRGRRTVA